MTSRHEWEGERDLVGAEVDRFCSRAIGPRAARPEAPMSPDEMDALLADARQMGIVPECRTLERSESSDSNVNSESPGAGLWEDADHGARQSVFVLRRLARANAGFAWAAHVASLAAVVARRLAFPTAGRGAIVVSGRFGIGRDAIARVLANAPLDEADRALLSDVWSIEGARLATMAHRFDWLLVPFFAGDALHWARVPHDTVRLEAFPNAHGFDELATSSVRATRPSAVTSVDGAAGQAVFATALGATALGATAVALGAAERALSIARDYARLRRQGGDLIERHAAIQQLLGRARASVENVGATLDAIASDPIAPNLLRILALRSEAHVALCQCANDAMQVLGGVGYMRDAGIEKVVRDLNHLRVTSGSPMELRLIVGEWSRHVA